MEKGIEVYLRFKPGELDSRLKTGPKKVVADASSLVKNGGQNKLRFAYDGTFIDVSQENIFNKIGKQTVSTVLGGVNGTVLAYGQTGAGKTFTMTGSNTFKSRGLCPRMLDELFVQASELSNETTEFSFGVSYTEIYNESFYDLLAPNDEASLTIHELSDGSTTVRGLKMIPISTSEEALSHLFEGEMNRAIGEHQLNKSSTRSHCIFTIHVKKSVTVFKSEAEDEEPEVTVVKAKLNMVDLAGSERVAKTESSGQIFFEARHINRSLTFLEQVVLALTDQKRDHVPYRQSKLTHLLKGALGGNCKTTLIACVWAEMMHFEETLSTLRFAHRMMGVKNKPTVNVQRNPTIEVLRLEREVTTLRNEIALYDQIRRQDPTPTAELPEAAQNAISSQVISFLKGESEHKMMPLNSVRQIQHAFSIMAEMLRNGSNWEEIQKQQTTIIGTEKANESSTGNVPSNDSNINNSDQIAIPSDDGFKDPSIVDGNVTVSIPTPTTNNNNDDNNESEESNATSTNNSNKDNNIDDTTNNDNSKESTSEVATTENNINDGSEGNQVQVPIAPPKFFQPGRDPVVKAPPVPSDSYESESEAFEAFKVGDGKEWADRLTDTKHTLRTKKKKVKVMVAGVNGHKKSIDKLMEQLQGFRLRKELAATEGKPFTEEKEEEEVLEELKKHKTGYQKEMTTLKAAKSEIQYTSRIVEECRGELMSAFQRWFNGPDDDKHNSPPKSGTPVEQLDIDSVRSSDFAKPSLIMPQKQTRNHVSPKKIQQQSSFEPITPPSMDRKGASYEQTRRNALMQSAALKQKQAAAGANRRGPNHRPFAY
eukprot:TRINITY_DN1413_c0_g1_i1.p1 TRINITY_DN1413_c0_g1~~TRINITY_DN1413_c0_g1_i1.p1  ORF type:complete len:822 (+),score=248.85 TRINITY_DN1413_c0_g1_i1:54-2519(+)